MNEPTRPDRGLKIVAACLQFRKSGDKRILLTLPPPARHADIWLAQSAFQLGTSIADEGFLDSEGKFRERRQAMFIARDAKQLIREPKSVHLTTDDLW